MTDETKHEAFVRLANIRLGNATKSIALLGNLTGSRYESTELLRKTMVGELERNVADLRKAYKLPASTVDAWNAYGQEVDREQAPAPDKPPDSPAPEPFIDKAGFAPWDAITSADKRDIRLALGAMMCGYPQERANGIKKLRAVVLGWSPEGTPPDEGSRRLHAAISLGKHIEREKPTIFKESDHV